MSTPQSVIYICSGVDLNSRYEHSIYFASASDQEEYFAGKVVRTLSAYSYLRKSWPIKVEATMEQAKTWNYLFFHNKPTGKVYYYFINTVEYINDSTVELGLELDVIQTYLFDFQEDGLLHLRCFVERQHSETDVAGEYTVDEGLELGELYDNGRMDIDPGNFAIMIMSTINPGAASQETAIAALPYSYNGVFSGVKIWAVDGSRWAEWGEQLERLSEWGKSEAIVAMWMYPKSLVQLGGEADWNDDTLVLPVEKAKDHSSGLRVSFGGYRETLDGYTPKNQKLHTFPFQFIYGTNNQGNSAVYHFERFDGSEDNGFAISGSLTPDGGVRLTPIGYNGLTYNYKEGLTLTGYPTCAWDSDIYKMWLAQNQNSQNLNLATGVLKVAGGIIGGLATAFTGVGAAVGIGTAVSGAMQIGDALAQKSDKELEPPQARGNFSTSVNITNKMHAFSLYERCVSYERARIIDEYFTMYGYKLNRVKRPDIKARPSFTYVKTVGCHITGNMCNEDILKIESIFDRGITFWRDGDRVADYTQNNGAPVG